MTSQAHIVSFEDAKASARATRAYSSRLTLAGGSAERRAVADADRSDGEPRVVRGEKRSRAQERKRQRTKERAGRMFAKQFGGDLPEGRGADSSAPRAAVYKAEMGSAHRKSARMQRSSTAGSPSAKLDPAGWLADIPVSARAIKAATAVLCVILVCAFLYVPAQQYYQAQRERDRLAAEYAVIEQRNDTLDVQNDILASDAGLEDAVRQKYGYVKAGEQVGVVSGLSASTTDTSRDSENIEANVLSSSVKSPEEWYTPFLDAFFGVG